MKGYTTKKAIEEYLLITIDSDFDSRIDSWIEAIENYIDNYTGRNFKADEENKERVFDGNGNKSILIDDIIEISKVELSEDDRVSFNEITEFLLYPANKIPKNKLVLENDYFTKGKQNLRITGKWGYSEEVPENIKFAATVFVANIINFSLHADGEVSQISVGRVNVSFKDEDKRNDFNTAKETLDLYKKFTF